MFQCCKLFFVCLFENINYSDFKYIWNFDGTIWFVWIIGNEVLILALLIVLMVVVLVVVMMVVVDDYNFDSSNWTLSCSRSAATSCANVTIKSKSSQVKTLSLIQRSSTWSWSIYHVSELEQSLKLWRKMSDTCEGPMEVRLIFTSNQVSSPSSIIIVIPHSCQHHWWSRCRKPLWWPSWGWS